MLEDYGTPRPSAGREGEATTIQCAHGDVSLYPLAEVDLEIDGIQRRVKLGSNI